MKNHVSPSLTSFQRHPLPPCTGRCKGKEEKVRPKQQIEATHSPPTPQTPKAHEHQHNLNTRFRRWKARTPDKAGTKWGSPGTSSEARQSTCCSPARANQSAAKSTDDGSGGKDCCELGEEGGTGGRGRAKRRDGLSRTPQETATSSSMQP